MQLLLERTIIDEAKKRIAKYSHDRYYISKYRATFRKRTGKKPKIAPKHVPASWDFHRHFDPRYCINHASFITKGLWSSLQAGVYKPTKALRVQIAKPSGGSRCLDTFSVPDAAVAKIFFNNLRLRNAKIFSDSSFAYQAEKTTLDAIIRLNASLSSETVFISQYDFRKYFDSINHECIEEALSQKGPFLTTHMERQVLGALIRHDFEDQSGVQGQRDVGIPQGNSLSLFLANVAAHSLDVELGMLNGSFARFADDSVVVNRSYEDALHCADAYHRFTSRSGVEINPDKSTGIRIFSDVEMEMEHVKEFEFLSYKFTRHGLQVSDRAVRNIKRRCIKIIYNNLLLHPRRVKSYSPKRIGPKFRDWDLTTCINELRAFVYGGRRQKSIDDYLSGATKLSNISGAVSYFALVQDGDKFRELDGWLHDMVSRAYKARVNLLNSIGSKTVRHISRPDLLNGSWYKFSSIPLETGLPSFFTAWRAARKSWLHHGLGGINPQGMGYAY
jgi:RNA-directed DNA polymerase